jgi:hypothetical protein
LKSICKRIALNEVLLLEQFKVTSPSTDKDITATLEAATRHRSSAFFFFTGTPLLLFFPFLFSLTCDHSNGCTTSSTSSY